jgi:alkylation response protein AidB-like acyl-CoA dehydrogenase
LIDFKSFVKGAPGPESASKTIIRFQAFPYFDQKRQLDHINIRNLTYLNICIMIEFTLSPEQNAIRSRVAAFSAEFLSSAHVTYEKPSTQKERFQALRPFYGQAVKRGLVKGLIPRALGGTGGTVTDAAILVEAMIKEDRSLSMTIFSTGLGLSPLLIAGSSEQKDKFLKPFLSCEGEPLASLLHSEPHGTANWLEKGGAGLKTVARKDGDEWVISGEKATSLLLSSRVKLTCK